MWQRNTWWMNTVVISVSVCRHQVIRRSLYSAVDAAIASGVPEQASSVAPWQQLPPPRNSVAERSAEVGTALHCSIALFAPSDQKLKHPTKQPTSPDILLQLLPTMVNVISVFTVALAAVTAVASGASMRSEAAPMPTGSWPASKGTVYLKEPYTVKKGQTFDGGMKT
ncbi:hypothetical protein PI124_g23587 [Phytophthora idaei]|nr:hypothetical protein PI124_g23587 [Phytophthora idaei]